MSAAKYLAFDFGASSGRAILGTIEHHKIFVEEVHRFNNQPVEMLGHIYWDVLHLFDELKKGIARTVKIGHKDIRGIGVDTWGVDFGLISKDDQLLGNPFAYRDSRTDRIMERAFQLLPRDEMYAYTGIQFLQFNSVFQLFSMVETDNSLLEIADTLLFMPDLFNFFLTGEKMSEYTIASTSQLLNAKQRKWEPAIFEKLNLPREIMPTIVQPGTVIGKLLPEIAGEIGISAVNVICPACHDTGSAVAAVPAKKGNWAYLSSGTWSLLGLEADHPIINKNSLQHNFTNEGGVAGKIRFLRNTMGLWLLQRCQQSWEQRGTLYDYCDLVDIAQKAAPFKSIVNPDDPSFLNPRNMAEAIVAYCKKTNQPYPEKNGEFVRCILESLALKYRHLIDKINVLQSDPIEILHIVGGGSQNGLLNQFAANATGIPVIAGPAEATALGNIMVQAIANHELASVQEGRELISRSFDLKYYEPQHKNHWEEIYQDIKWQFE